MQEQNLEFIKTAQLPSRTLRDWVAPCFRRRRLMGSIFLMVMAGAILLTLSMPARYEAEVKILVKRERADAVVNPDPNGQMAMASLTEEDLNSEVALLKSRDLLEKVVIECGLDTSTKRSMLGKLSGLIDGESQDAVPAAQLRKLRAVQNLEKTLDVEPIKKTKLILVSYESQNPIRGHSCN